MSTLKRDTALSKAKSWLIYLITWKRFEILCKFVLFTNRKWHTGFRLVPKSVALIDADARTLARSISSVDVATDSVSKHDQLLACWWDVFRSSPLTVFWQDVNLWQTSQREAFCDACKTDPFFRQSWAPDPTGELMTLFQNPFLNQECLLTGR